MNMSENSKEKDEVEELASLMDSPSKLDIDKLPPPEGVSKEVVAAVKGEKVDDRLYEYKELAEKIQSMPKVEGIPTGIDKLDKLLDGGIHPGELMILSATTGQGKTSLCQTMSYIQALRGIPSVWFTLEMGWQEITNKFMLMDSKFKTTGNISKLPIYYPTETRGLSLAWLEKHIIKAKEKYNAKMVYIDHLHFLVPLSGGKSNTSYLVGEIVREIKLMATRLKIPILLVAHTKKTDINTVPDINSPRDSSFIGQESNFLLTLWRKPKAQQKSKAEEDYDVSEDIDIFEDVTMLSLVKNRRNGNMKKIALGMYNGMFIPYKEFQDLKLVSDMGNNNEELDKLHDKISKKGETEEDERVQKILFG